MNAEKLADTGVGGWIGYVVSRIRVVEWRMRRWVGREKWIVLHQCWAPPSDGCRYSD